EEHDYLDVVDAESWPHRHGDFGNTANLFVASGGHVQLITDQHFVVDHAGEETIDGTLHRFADAVVVEQTDVGLGGRTHAKLREVDDAASRDLAEGSV